MDNEEHKKMQLECETIKREIDGLRSDIAELKAAVSGLVEAWRTANGVVRFVKWSAALMTAFAALAVSAKVGWRIFVHNIKESVL